MKEWLRRVLSAFFSTIGEVLYLSFLVLIGGVFGMLLIYFSDTTDVTKLLDRPLAETSVIFDRTGMVTLYELHGEENRTVVGHDDIPDVVRLATVAAEDRSFYRNFGIDPFSVIRALRANFQAGHIEQGASTITQQIARSDLQYASHGSPLNFRCARPARRRSATTSTAPTCASAPLPSR